MYNKNYKYFDVIVIGAGPAGVTSAYLLKKLGFNVLILEKKKLPRPKLCGGLLTKKTLDLIMKIFNVNKKELIDKKIINHKSNKYKVYYKDQLIAFNDTEYNFHFVNRSEYDNFWVNKAKDIGVLINENEKVLDINFEENIIYTKNNNWYKSNYIIAADGANSIVRNKLIKTNLIKEKYYVKKNTAMSIESHVPKNKINRTINHPILYFGIINWGYGWVFPKKDKITIGVGGLVNKNENFTEIFSKFLDTINIKTTSSNIQGWPIPFGNYLKKPAFNNTLLIGDAANFADPLTGEGIYFAHKSAQLAANTIEKSMINQVNISDIYIKKINKNINNKLRKVKVLRNLLWALPLKIQKRIVNILSKQFNNKISNMIQGFKLK